MYDLGIHHEPAGGSPASLLSGCSHMAWTFDVHFSPSVWRILALLSATALTAALSVSQELCVDHERFLWLNIIYYKL